MYPIPEAKLSAPIKALAPLALPWKDMLGCWILCSDGSVVVGSDGGGVFGWDDLSLYGGVGGGVSMKIMRSVPPGVVAPEWFVQCLLRVYWCFLRVVMSVHEVR